MRSFNDQNDNVMNENKMSKLAKGVLAAGFAVGGAASFGGIDVMAAEGEEIPAVETEGSAPV